MTSLPSLIFNQAFGVVSAADTKRAGTPTIRNNRHWNVQNEIIPKLEPTSRVFNSANNFGRITTATGARRFVINARFNF